MEITGFLVLDEDGEQIAADPHGNNVAFSCFTCGHPILAVALDNQRGGDAAHPVSCIGCKAQYFLDLRPASEKLYIQRAELAPNNSFKPNRIRRPD